MLGFKQETSPRPLGESCVCETPLVPAFESPSCYTICQDHLELTWVAGTFNPCGSLLDAKGVYLFHLDEMQGAMTKTLISDKLGMRTIMWHIQYLLLLRSSQFLYPSITTSTACLPRLDLAKQSNSMHATFSKNASPKYVNSKNTTLSPPPWTQRSVGMSPFSS